MRDPQRGTVCAMQVRTPDKNRTNVDLLDSLWPTTAILLLPARQAAPQLAGPRSRIATSAGGSSGPCRPLTA